MDEFRIRPFGEAALLVEFDAVVDPAVNAAVLALDRAVAQAAIPGVIETVPSFRALLVQFDPIRTEGGAVADALSGLEPDRQAGGSGRVVTLPVAYGGDAGPDLADVAERVGLSETAVIEAHSGADHSVYMLGFLPGLPYLGGLPEALYLPRRTDPRIDVPARSVAIAVGQTVIYPKVSPGGWHLIGRTPAEMFDLRRDQPALVAPGDIVRFEPISVQDLAKLEGAVAAGDWMPEVQDA